MPPEPPELLTGVRVGDGAGALLWVTTGVGVGVRDGLGAAVVRAGCGFLRTRGVVRGFGDRDGNNDGGGDGDGVTPAGSTAAADGGVATPVPATMLATPTAPATEPTPKAAVAARTERRARSRSLLWLRITPQST